MADALPRVVCCGHVCLDVIPSLGGEGLPGPGELVQVGPAEVAAGGSVSNTGLALHRLGVPVRLIGRVGDDLFGREVQHCYEAQGGGLADHLQVDPTEVTSYTIVVNPPDQDRRFMHCPGVNATFTDAHIDDHAFERAEHFHFGYPPLMRSFCADHGQPLARLFDRAKAAGLTTSLDMAGIDPNSWAGRITWPALLKNVLPRVDLFLPSADELQAMLGTAEVASIPTMGCPCVVVKDGQHGVTVTTSADADRLVPGWVSQRLHGATYQVPVRGTTGAGDVTIAGFLAGFLQRRSLPSTIDLACAAGAHCVQQPDALTGVPDLATLDRYLNTHPPRRSA